MNILITTKSTTFHYPIHHPHMSGMPHVCTSKHNNHLSHVPNGHRQLASMAEKLNFNFFSLQKSHMTHSSYCIGQQNRQLQKTFSFSVSKCISVFLLISLHEHVSLLHGIVLVFYFLLIILGSLIFQSFPLYCCVWPPTVTVFLMWTLFYSESMSHLTSISTLPLKMKVESFIIY